MPTKIFYSTTVLHPYLRINPNQFFIIDEYAIINVKVVANCNKIPNYPVFDTFMNYNHIRKTNLLVFHSGLTTISINAYLHTYIIILKGTN